ncbi:MAG TPA: ethanolamine ammonia-lyase reactivating factor EutA [Magnetospirillaceae bacterium]|nr:ethanolamine ammonia-lyase reactivating factor EutA [Magnetospirillaceae bacterium]
MSSDQAPKIGAGHVLGDHSLGRELTHAHAPGGDYDHDHDDFGDPGDLEDNPIWLQDHVSLTSVGIDIGSSGTQVIFSRIKLRRLGEDLSSRYFVTARDTLFLSPVALTPYESDRRIDQGLLGAIIDDAYNAARVGPEDIDTGAVILTGEALRRENAEAIAGILAERGGDFVCATAGHNMEAMLAAFGSGAAALSRETGRRILNIDIGGGTTKLGVVEEGRVAATAAFHVGGRLQVVDGDGRIVRLDPAGRALAARAGFSWSLGDRVSPADLDRLADSMAEAVIAAVLDEAGARELYLTDPLPGLEGIGGVMFSGGVAEYVYRREERDFGDLGRRLGTALRKRLDAGALPWELLPPRECIRATALGASEYSVQLSGNTLFLSDHTALLPRRNLQIVRPPCDLSGAIEAAAVATAIRTHLASFDLDGIETELGLAFHWQGPPSYERVAAFARGVADGLAGRIAAGRPLYLILDSDLAQTLGTILHHEMGLGCPLLVIDGVLLWDFDYIDLGKIRLPSHTIPVTVKSLLFTEDPRRPAPPRHGHGHDHHHDHDHDHEHEHGHDHHHHHHHGHRSS